MPLLTLIICLIAGCAERGQEDVTTKPHDKFEIKINGKVLYATYFYRQEDINNIRSARELVSNQAIVLVCKPPRYAHLYLKDSNANFSVLFLDQNLKVIEIADLDYDNEEGVTSSSEVSYCILVKQNWCRANDVKEGAQVEFPQQMKDIRIEEMPFATINGKKIYLEIACKSAERSRGLKYRPRLSKHTGMLFVYKDEDYHSFWMQDTKIPLEILYIRKDGVISSIENLEPENEIPVRSKEPVMYAIEVNRGWTEENGIKKGMKVKLPEIPVSRIE